MAKVTFKKHTPTGPYASFDHRFDDIKYDGKVCGSLTEGRNYNGVKIRLMVEDGDSFRWVTLKHRPDTFDEARQFVRDKFKLIQFQFNLQYFTS